MQLSPEERRRIDAEATRLANRAVLARLRRLAQQVEREESAKRRLLPWALGVSGAAIVLAVIVFVLWAMP